jgi:hypothetical protein
MRSGRGGQKGTDTYAEHVKTHRAKAHFSGRLDLVYSPSTSMSRVLIYLIASLDYHRCKIGICTFGRTATRIVHIT